MSIDTVSRNSPADSAATMITARSREASTLTRVEILAEALSMRGQARPPTVQPAINAEGQPTGTLINIIA